MTTLLDPVNAPVGAPTGGAPGDPAGPGGPGRRHRVLATVEAVGKALDAAGDVPGWSMTPAEQREALVALRAQRTRLHELELRVLVAADRNQVGADSGATSTPAWLADATGTSRADCFADLPLAEALDDGFDATRRALAAGVIDLDRARVIVHAVSALVDEHDDLPSGTHHAAEAHLLDLATRFDATLLRRLGKRLFEVVGPEAADAAEGRRVADEEERARRLAYLSLRDNGDGTTEGRFRLPSLHADLLGKALDALTAPGRLRAARQDPVTGKKLPRSTLFGRGLIDLLEHHLDLTTMPTAAGSPFTLVVTIGLETLRTGLGTATVETGTRISAGEARRLACAAGIIPMVLDGDSVPTDLGRERRLFSKHQMIALVHRYHGCAATNCDRPPAWTEIHHLDPRHQGGQTNLDRGIPLCRPHDHMADRPDAWTMSRLPDGGVRFTRRT
jgi:hypothetical protein